jgi:hypothetical protein
VLGEDRTNVLDGDGVVNEDEKMYVVHGDTAR